MENYRGLQISKIMEIADMEELRADLSESIEKFDFLLSTCQERILSEFFSHLLKTNRITVTILLFAVKSALLAHDSNLISIVRAIEETEGAATAVMSKEEVSK
jgi:hypothetical protein